MRVFAISILFLTIAAPVLACLWDRDTFAMEAKGRLEVVETAVGWFDRFPPEYYQMRLDRVAPDVTAHPERLDLYDDAGVACDRLGNHAEAVVWMEKKGLAMQLMAPDLTKDHRYRMLANLGVFHTHLWLKSADRVKNVGLLDQAIQDVKTALEINPNAHFGRERAHLALLEWWKAGLTAQAENPERLTTGLYVAHSFDEAVGNDLDTDFVKGLCGLIQMGSAQESVDVHVLLAKRLISIWPKWGSHRSLCYLTCLRVGELVVDQKSAVNPLLMHEAEWKKFVNSLQTSPADRKGAVNKIGQELIRTAGVEGSSHDDSIISGYFHEARAAAARRHTDKTAFMLAQFKQGRHPDTHADFWQGWKEPALPPLPPQAAAEKYAGLALGGWLLQHKTELLGGLFMVGALFSLFVILAVVRRRVVGRR